MSVSTTGCFRFVFNDCGFIINESEHGRILIFNECEQETALVFKQSRFCFQFATPTGKNQNSIKGPKYSRKLTGSILSATINLLETYPIEYRILAIAAK